MKTKYITLFIFFAIFSQSTYSFAKTHHEQTKIKIGTNCIEEKNNPNWKGFLHGYLPALGIASGLGAASGLTCALLENKGILPWPISWFLLWGTRGTAIALLSEDMKKQNIPHNKTLCCITARLIDWIVYLCLKKNYDDSLII